MFRCVNLSHIRHNQPIRMGILRGQVRLQKKPINRKCLSQNSMNKPDLAWQIYLP